MAGVRIGGETCGRDVCNGADICFTDYMPYTVLPVITSDAGNDILSEWDVGI